jgi:outer membrane protein insertion porin family
MTALTLLAAMTAPVAVSAAPPIAGEIRIHGNTQIKTHIIRREIPFSPGDQLDEAGLNGARLRIQRLPGVDHAQINLAQSPTDSSFALSVSITEKPAIEGKFRFERGFENEMGYGLTMAHHNFRGRSEKLWATFLLPGGQSYEAGWENPWIATRHRIGVGARLFYDDYKYVYPDAGKALIDADTRRLGGEASLFWSWGGPSRVTAAVGYESVEGDVDGITIDPDRDNYMTVSLGARLDRRDGIRYPWQGAYLETVAAQIGPGDDKFDIFEGTVDARGYLPIRGRMILAAHSHLTYRDGDAVPLYRREHLGGARTLRGYDYGSFHGSNALVNGFELRIPANFSRQEPMESMLLGVALHLFADAAAAWEMGEDVDTDLFYGTYGVGITLLNRNFMPIRMDWGWHDGSDVRFEFDFGMKF